MKKLPYSFYDRDDVIAIARELLGKVIVTNIKGKKASGRIIETEAYVAFIDKASHSYKGRKTARNEHMYSAPGTAYIYICYGMHQMMNVVTNKEGIPDAILIRAIEPLAGVQLMQQRTGKGNVDYTITRGPGNVGKALGISKDHSGFLLLDDTISIYDDGFSLNDIEIGASKRIGVKSAGKDGLLPYRYYIKGNKYVSGRPR